MHPTVYVAGLDHVARDCRVKTIDVLRRVWLVARHHRILVRLDDDYC